MAPWQPSGMSMTSCNHMCCHSRNGSQEPIFNNGLTLQGCFCTITTLPLPDRYPDLYPIMYIWDHLGW
ncbi:hypothetical protein TNCV_2023771 [Trichonephila clavipes]|nr:hypothetical protein TNCV_2023771 [Trichonephila clavipes]